MDIARQILLNALVSGGVLSLVAIGFAYIFQVTKVFHLAHAAIYVLGGFLFWWVSGLAGHWYFGVVAALLVVAVAAWLLEKAVYLPGGTAGLRAGSIACGHGAGMKF